MSTESPSPPSLLSTPKQPWEPDAGVVIPEKPDGWDHGYVVQNKAYGCTRQGLAEAITDLGSQITYVWIPESNEPVRPATVEFLTPAFQKHARSGAKSSFIFGFLFLTIAIVIAIVTNNWSVLYRSFYGVFGVLALVEGAWTFYGAKSVSVKDLEADQAAGHFGEWVEKAPTSIDTVVVCGVLIVVLLTQILAGEKESIDIAALVKPAVWQGQVWRLATATLMHVNPMHFLMNFFSLVFLARLIERTLNPRYLTIVFLASGIVGSVLSVLLYPNTTSVGASGGILGLLGFVTVAAWLHQDIYPNRYFRRLIEGIVLTAVLGIIGFAFIDNAAHVGGLLCGGVLGWIFLRSSDYRDKVALSILSAISLVLVLLTAGFAVVKLLGFW